MVKKKTTFKDLREFVETLDRAGELLKIKDPVSTHLEITQITDIMCKSPGGGKALLFENVRESDFPVITNAYGSDKRICIALGVDNLDQLASRLRKFLEIGPPEGLRDHLKLLPLGIDFLRALPRKTRKKPPCQEVVRKNDDVDLSILPVLHCWPQDGGPFITFPLVITKSLRTGKRNVGMYRLQVFDSKTTGMHWHVHKDGSHYFQEYRKAGKKMPVAVAIGTDPATTYAATAPLPRGVDELLLSGFIRRAPVPLTRCLTIPLEVPAFAEFVLEGYVDPYETRPEGPFGDHTGYYSLVDEYPVFHVTALTHRSQPLYFTTIVGRPPMEDCYLAKATERLFLPMLTAIFPEITDYWLPWEGVFHNITVAAMQKEYPGHAFKLMNALWGQGQMSFSKILVMVDIDVNLNDPENLVRHLLNTLDLDKDILVTQGVLDVLDHSAPQPLVGGKIGIDATRRLQGETPRSHRKNTPAALLSREEILKSFRSVCGKIVNVHAPLWNVKNIPVLLNVEKDVKHRGKQIAEILLRSGLDFFSIFVLFDGEIDLLDSSLIFWKLFNNVDPIRDIYRESGKIVIDATKKGPEDGHDRPWPNDIVMSEEIVTKVESYLRCNPGFLNIISRGSPKILEPSSRN